MFDQFDSLFRPGHHSFGSFHIIVFDCLRGNDQKLLYMEGISNKILIRHMRKTLKTMYCFEAASWTIIQWFIFGI